MSLLLARLKNRAIHGIVDFVAGAFLLDAPWGALGLPPLWLRRADKLDERGAAPVLSRFLVDDAVG